MLSALLDPKRPLNGKEVVLIFLLFVAIAYLYLGANIFEGEIVAPMDIILEAEGWGESGLSIPVTNYLRGDILDAWLPRWIYAKQRLINGEVPMWNPLVAGGQPAFPLLADSYLSPSFILFCLFEDGLGFTLGLLMRLLLAGTGAYFLCRLAMGRLAAFFAGMTYMMCGFNASWLMWPQVATSAWIPWVVWGTIKLLQEPGVLRVSLLALLTTALFLGGFPAVAAYGLLLAGIMASWLLGSYALKRGLSSALKRLLWLAGALILSLALGAIQLLPFWEYLHHVDLSWRAGWSIPFSKIILLILPFWQGELNPEYCGYVGIVAMLFAAFSILFAICFKDSRGGPCSPLFWSIAALFTLMIVYGQPASLVNLLRQLPVFNFNQNGRMLSLFGLEMSVLAGFGLQAGITLAVTKFWSPTGRRFVCVGSALITMVFLAQFLDLQRIGRSQNAIVPKRSFFPDTRLIREVQASLLPGQSVIQTHESFRNPGILTAYGLKEWFAHAHRLKSEKDLLGKLVENPWVSPTAALLFSDKINFDSPYFDIFSIRYALISSPAVAGHSRPDSYVLLGPGQKIVQRFSIDRDVVVSGVQVLTAAYGPGSDPDCGLKAVLKRGDDTWIGMSAKPKESVGHHRWTSFHFDKKKRLETGDYLLQLEALGTPLTKPLVIGASPDTDRYQGGSLIDASGIESGDLAFRVLGIQDSTHEYWKVRHSGQPVVLFENREVPPGGFLLSSKEDFEKGDFSQIWWSDLQVLKTERERIEYEVSCKEACWQVESARGWPGWRVTVDGDEKPVETFLDVLRGVKVPAGRHLVSWQYVSPLWSYGWKISLFTLLFLAVLNVAAMSSSNAGSRKR